ncbi:serine/threonine-protein kinase [Hyalangium gracile]|uniref:serine/threonine-protein kinase n=1 Tax=Hyalangium gracile TaxID=394092 RepID=UPI001CD02EB2|nr:serine/threonine-protein kinase [Hyalangium gracile]
MFDDASTPRPTAERPPRRPEEPSFPVPGWERYEPVRFLGQGGMGRVFLAFDPRLRRAVALKFVRGDEPGLARRFLSEGQAQARVEHERVCKVYEVGEVQGHLYIAMQYVDGVPLTALAGQLTLEQKVVLLQQAAEGVHAAHRAGLIHRDLKPGNILVERTADQRPRAYVMDFGLARDWTAKDTATGTVLGTPHYMAPEQARGEVSQLDGRADVYSLGATLYFLLTGQPPLPGHNGLEVLGRIATEEPRPPRALAPDVPAELEAIVLKCLEKERSARYDSALALAEELGRFLAGAPVRARSAGAGYRLRKRLRGHWRGVAVTAGVLVLLGLAGGQLFRARQEALRREQLARQFSALADGLEARARASALARLHDTSAERQSLKATLEEIEAAMRREGALALGPGNQALGRGWLSLGAPRLAHERLRDAWQYGSREPQGAFAMALALGRLYQAELLAAEELRSRLREPRRRELARLYREPALSWLRRSQGASVPSPEYVAALEAFLEERFEEALARLDALGERLPGFFEAPQLRGDVHLARASHRWARDERPQARAELESARQAYARAAALGESAPELHRAQAWVELVALRLEPLEPRALQAHVSRALEALARALVAAPRDYESWVLQAQLYRHLAESLAPGEEDIEPLLRKAVEAAQRAVAFESARLEARRELGLIFLQWARYRQDRSLDPREQLLQARDALESLGPRDEPYEFHTRRGQLLEVEGDAAEQRGQDELPHRDGAIESYLAAATADGQEPEAWRELGSAYLARASSPRAVAPEGDLRQAQQALEKARALAPRDAVRSGHEGRLHALRARLLRNLGADPRPEWEAALALYRQGQELSPGLSQLARGEGLALVALAREAWERGEEPFPLLARAQAVLERAVAQAPGQGLELHFLAEAHAQRAAYRLAWGEPPGSEAQEALRLAREAIARLPGDARPWATAGRAHQLLAAFELTRQREPRPALTEADKALRQALERNPRSAEAWRSLAETRAVSARFSALQGRARREDFEQAAQAWREALALSSQPLEDRLALAAFHRDQATWEQRTGRNPKPTLRRGLALADEVLASRPEWAEARLVRALLRVALGQEPLRQGEHPAAWRQAEEERRAILAAHPNLRRAWSLPEEEPRPRGMDEMPGANGGGTEGPRGPSP